MLIDGSKQLENRIKTVVHEREMVTTTLFNCRIDVLLFNSLNVTTFILNVKISNIATGQFSQIVAKTFVITLTKFLFCNLFKNFFNKNFSYNASRNLVLLYLNI